MAGSDFIALLRINTLKRTHAEGALNQVLRQIRALEDEIKAVQDCVITAHEKLLAGSANSLQNDKVSESQDAFFYNIGVFERWETQQRMKAGQISQKIETLQPELERLKSDLKVLIVREDTLRALAKADHAERRRVFDDKTAQTTQDLWLTTERKSGRA